MSGFYSLELTPDFMEELRETLAEMIDPVRIDVFIGPNCQTCDDTVRLMKAIEEASPVRGGKRLIDLRIHDKSKPEDQEAFKAQGIDRIPSVTLIEGYIRYTGIPAGEEIRGLIETIMRISEGDSGLEDSTKEALADVKGRVHIETIVTPSCPYCPYAALLANMFAYEAYKQGVKNIISDTVEAYENPDIADKYGVMSVPAIAINGKMTFVGVPYEEDFLEYVKAAAEGRLQEVAPIDMGDATGL